MDSNDLGKYIEAKDGMTKPWLLAQMRLLKLQEAKDTMTPLAYQQRLVDIHQDLFKLGEWWVGREDEVFGEPDS
jgi:hypothetical protein